MLITLKHLHHAFDCRSWVTTCRALKDWLTHTGRCWWTHRNTDVLMLLITGRATERRMQMCRHNVCTSQLLIQPVHVGVGGSHNPLRLSVTPFFTNNALKTCESKVNPRNNKTLSCCIRGRSSEHYPLNIILWTLSSTITRHYDDDLVACVINKEATVSLQWQHERDDVHVDVDVVHNAFTE